MKDETRTIVVEPERYRFRGLIFTLPSGENLPMNRRSFAFGTSPDSDVVLEGQSVSRIHASVEVDATGYCLVDSGSKNGTFVNGTRVERCYLPAKGVLSLGKVDLQFVQSDGLVEVALSRQNEMGGLVGKSPGMREIFATLERVAPTRIPVLIEGESGTGKELAARALHQRGEHPDGPFIIFDCSAIQSELLESELFGHAEGAFTGASQDRIGALELAEGGTLFIDEIGELSLDLQPKLLRALDSGEFKRVGGTERRISTARIVAATHHFLARDVEAGSFRQDLFYRLAGLQIRLPSLRERKTDIPLLVKHFLREMGERATGVQIPYETMKKMEGYPWPGNVRELKNTVERAVVLSAGTRVETRYLQGQEPVEAGEDSESFRFDLPFKDAKARLLEVFERAYWDDKLAQSEGNISQAARDGGIHRKSLEYLIKKHEIEINKGN